MLLSGSSFKDFFPGFEFIKVVTHDDTQKFNVKLKDGLNEIPLKQTHMYVDGGISFCEKDNILNAIKKVFDAKYIRKVELIDDANVFIDDNEYLTDKATLGEKVLIEDLKEWENKEFCMKAIKVDVKFLKYIKNLTDEMKMEILLKDIYAIEYIKDPTFEMQKYVVTKSPYLIRHIKNPSLELVLIAITEAPYSVRYIDNLSEEIILELVKVKPAVIEFVKNLPEEVYCEVVSKDGKLIKHITIQTQKICDVAFANDKASFPHIQKKFKTYDMCLEAVKLDGDYLDFVPDDHFLDSVIMEALSRSGNALRFIKDPDDKMCFTALNNNPAAIHHIKKPTDAMYLIACKTQPQFYNFIKDKSIINDQERLIELVNANPELLSNINNPTYEQCLKAVKKSGRLIKDVPKEHHTEELCLIAIQDFPDALSWIDGDKQTDIMCISGVVQKGQVIRYVKKQNHDVCLAAVENDGLALEFVDELYQTIDIVKVALKQNNASFKFIKNKTEEVLIYAVTLDPFLLHNMLNPVNYYNGTTPGAKINVSENVIKEAVGRRGYLLRYVTKELQTFEICKMAVINDPCALEHVLPEFQTDEIVLPTLEKNGIMLMHVQNKTPKRCYVAVKSKPLAIRYVTDQTPELCELAISLDYDALTCIKKQTPELCMHAVSRHYTAMRHVENQEKTLCMHCVVLNPKSILYIKDLDTRSECELIIKEIDSHA